MGKDSHLKMWLACGSFSRRTRKRLLISDKFYLLILSFYSYLYVADESKWLVMWQKWFWVSRKPWDDFCQVLLPIPLSPKKDLTLRFKGIFFCLINSEKYFFFNWELPCACPEPHISSFKIKSSQQNVFHNSFGSKPWPEQICLCLSHLVWILIHFFAEIMMCSIMVYFSIL